MNYQEIGNNTYQAAALFIFHKSLKLRSKKEVMILVMEVNAHEYKK